MTSEQAATDQTGIIVVTHVDYGSALLRAAEFIVGPVQDCTCIQVDASVDVEETVSRLKEAVERLNAGNGVLVLTDMFGGTPTNMSLSLLASGHLEVLTGVNLPMLIKLASVRHNETLAEAVADAQEAGRKYINVASRLLAQDN